jgi:hypothetical protein
MFMIRWLIAAIMVVTVVPWSAQLVLDTWRHFQVGDIAHQLWIAGGFVAGILWIIWRRPNWLIHTFIHEACHALACLLLGVRIRNFQASDGKGGKVVHDKVDALRGTIIALAPYTLPLVLLPLLLWRAFNGHLPWLSGLVTFFWVYHLHGLYHNVRLNFWGKQADLSKAGKPLSIAAIATALFLVTAWTLRILVIP